MQLPKHIRVMSGINITMNKQKRWGKMERIILQPGFVIIRMVADFMPTSCYFAEVWSIGFEGSIAPDNEKSDFQIELVQVIQNVWNEDVKIGWISVPTGVAMNFHV